ncbi:universal stress protein [Desulfosporosinus nitroreducens]|uniref:universal stress protein n=1 Tax=Desulfosporosinus nitroreducens TaxID=2018668 RepID=UPI00207D205E|nr:universal stress protein [Desulfosporosinus nitroreducens]MCO1600527.1 universal stress protein [Desulfosporosinus nitroreducens]
MNGNPLKVLLYFDGSEHSLSAAVYTANLFNRIPNMHLTIVHAQENIQGSKLENSNLREIWSTDLILDWEKTLLDKVEFKHKSQYSKIIAKTHEIFFEAGQNVNQQVIFANSNIPDTVEAIINFATKKEFELIIMGTRGPSSLKGLVYGSLAHSVLNKSDIPVLLIKKLPQEFVDRFCSSPSGKNRGKGRRNHLYWVKTI